MRLLPHLLVLSIAVVTFSLPVLADEPADDDSTRVEGTFTLAAEVPSFEGQKVDIRLYEYDPFLADAGATLKDQVEIKDFGHTTGMETKREFVIGAEGKIKPRMSYYVTLFVLDGEKRTHMGKVPGEFLAKVITEGHPRKIEMQVKPVGK